MKTITLRNVPDEVHARLKEEAKKNRRSLNQEVIAKLAGDEARNARGETKAEAGARMDLAFAKIRELRKNDTYFMTTEQIQEAINDRKH